MVFINPIIMSEIESEYGCTTKTIGNIYVNTKSNMERNIGSNATNIEGNIYKKIGSRLNSMRRETRPKSRRNILHNDIFLSKPLVSFVESPTIYKGIIQIMTTQRLLSPFVVHVITGYIEETKNERV